MQYSFPDAISRDAGSKTGSLVKPLSYQRSGKNFGCSVQLERDTLLLELSSRRPEITSLRIADLIKPET
jgi:hypothetical protein